MYLWLYENDPPFALQLADETTTLCVALIAAGALDARAQGPEPECEVIDFAAVRAAREPGAV